MEAKSIPVTLKPETVRSIRLEGETGTSIGIVGMSVEKWSAGFPWMAVASNGRITGCESEGQAEARLIDIWVKDRLRGLRG